MMRTISFQKNYLIHPDGSCLVSLGNTKVICTAIVSEDQPPFLKGTESGWLTAEYAMLPGSTGGGRKRRETAKPDGRSTEIQRLIGRSLRSAVHLDALGPVTISIDCDVIQADGGTRVASICGGYVALVLALRKLAQKQGKSSEKEYLAGQVAAVSAGIVNGKVVCDLDYEADSNAEVDMNVVVRDNDFVEVQGTGEKGVFDRNLLNQILDVALEGIRVIQKAQREVLE